MRTDFTAGLKNSDNARARDCRAQMQALTLIGCMAILSLAFMASAAELPKLRIRRAGVNAGHLIEDANGKPFFMAGICPQNLIQKLRTADMEAYFKARHEQGFNAAWVVISGWDHFGKPPFLPNSHYDREDDVHDAAGNAIKLDPKNINFAPPNLNMAYVHSVDQMVIAAASNGIYLFLDPMNEPGMEWPRHTKQDCVAWGRFWGDRYAKYSNVNILMGTDDVPQPYSNWIVSGLRHSLSDRLYSIDQAIYDPKGMHDNIPNPWWQFKDQNATWINLWGWYVWETPNSMAQTGTYQYATWLMYSQAAHWGVPTAPTFIVESEYTSYPNDNGEGTGRADNIVMKQGDHALRRQMWSVPLGGGSGFGIIGNINDAINDPMTTLNDPTLKYIAYCKSFFTSLPWERLEPDYEHSFLTSQAGNPAMHDPTYVSSAITRDGTLGVIYYPGLNGSDFKLKVNMSQMGGGHGVSNAYWFDPTNATRHMVSGAPFANAGSRTLTTPGNNHAGSADWVLVIESSGH
jgi:hypothetical protein